MTTKIRTEDGRQFTVELVKQGREPLWDVSIIRGMGLAKESIAIGRIMSGGSGAWYRENGFGWEMRPTRKKCILSLVLAANPE